MSAQASMTMNWSLECSLIDNISDRDAALYNSIEG